MRYHPRQLGTLLLFALALAGCNPDAKRTDRQNPFYRQGLSLRREQRFEDAAAAFEKCARRAPDSVLVHLQLGMLYEDRLDQPVRALHHYQFYLAKGGESAPMARQSIARLRRRLAEKWAATDPELRTLFSQKVSSPTEPMPAARGPSKREKRLEDALRQLSRKLRAMHEHLRTVQASQTPSAPTPPPRSLSRRTPTASRSSTSARSAGAQPPAVPTYTVRRGDTLIGITKEVYGQQHLWPRLADWNRAIVGDDHRLMPGMVLETPSENRLRRGRPDSTTEARP